MKDTLNSLRTALRSRPEKTLTEKINVHVCGKKENKTCYTLPPEEIRRSEKKLISAVSGIPLKNIILLNQVHGDRIIQIDSPPDADLISAGEADGLITHLEGVCLTIRTADCVPVFAYSPEKKILGAVHSGWKGAKLKIAERLINEMISVYGCAPDKIKSFILPSIGPQNYEVKEDVAAFFLDDVIEKNGILRLNLPGNIERSLTEAGVLTANIFNSGICVYADNEEYFSHRKGDRGRNLNFAWMR